ncbi:MAG TPA: hypothetical protein VF981_08800 [Gemmatimonadaceae bacterium]
MIMLYRGRWRMVGWFGHGALVHAETRNRGGLKAIHVRCRPSRSVGAPKSDKQTNTRVGELQVRQELFRVLASELLDALDLHDESIIDDEICAISFLKHHTQVFEAKRARNQPLIFIEVPKDSANEPRAE